MKLFKDENGEYVKFNHGKYYTSKEAKEYYNKLNSFHDVNYYETSANETSSTIGFDCENEYEKTIRLLPLKNDNKYKNKNIEFGILTVNLENVLNFDGLPYYTEKKVINF